MVKIESFTNFKEKVEIGKFVSFLSDCSKTSELMNSNTALIQF